MRFLVVGSGGREHALVHALKLSPSVSEVHAVPGSKGIAQEAICHNIELSDPKAVEAFVRRYNFDCVVIGPENALASGLSDQLRTFGLNVVGPCQAAAQLEASKVFAKKFMEAAGVPTARFEVVEDVETTMRLAETFTPPYVLKADGLAAGKGVFICETRDELQKAAEDLFVHKTLGAAGRQALLEQFQAGYELSYLLLTNGQDGTPLPLAQDHKRLGDGDKGPNTGGMGTVAPVPPSEELQTQIQDRVITPTLRHLNGTGLLYRGVLFIGLMITQEGPQVLEFNVRFGDPETQSILPLLDGDWAQVFLNLSKGNMTPMKWNGLHLACVVLAAPGYPNNPEKGVEISGDIGAHSPSSYFLHAGTDRTPDGRWLVNGGRVLNAVGLGSSRREAIRHAYTQAEKVKWRGLQMRSDIGAKLS